jgi:hypothetical protein
MKKPFKPGLILFLLLALVVGQASCRKEKKRIKKIYDNDKGYAIGTINNYKKAPFKVTYNYSFTSGGSSYTGKDIARGIGQLDESLIGKMFLVVYNNSNASENDMNFNYSIKNQNTFDSLLIVFASSPPKPD